MIRLKERDGADESSASPKNARSLSQKKLRVTHVLKDLRAIYYIKTIFLKGQIHSIKRDKSRVLNTS